MTMKWSEKRLTNTIGARCYLCHSPMGAQTFVQLKQNREAKRMADLCEEAQARTGLWIYRHAAGECSKVSQ